MSTNVALLDRRPCSPQNAFIKLGIFGRGLSHLSLLAFEPVLFGRENSAGKRFGEAGDWRGTFGAGGPIPGARDHVFGSKATESQRLFREPHECGFARDCVVELAVLT
jgi:hypothetical protein